MPEPRTQPTTPCRSSGLRDVHRPSCHGPLQPQHYCAECGAYNPDEEA